MSFVDFSVLQVPVELKGEFRRGDGVQGMRVEEKIWETHKTASCMCEKASEVWRTEYAGAPLLHVQTFLLLLRIIDGPMQKNKTENIDIHKKRLLFNNYLNRIYH